jgi:hypothetical protein
MAKSVRFAHRIAVGAESHYLFVGHSIRQDIGIFKWLS